MTSTSTSAIQASAKLQVKLAKSGIDSKSDMNSVSFDALFSNAMGGKGPDAKLNAIESQLREALSNQQKEMKRQKDKEYMPPVTPQPQVPQDMVWAQRNWASQSAGENRNIQALESTSKQATSRASENSALNRNNNEKPQEQSAAESTATAENTTSTETQESAARPTQPAEGTENANTQVSSTTDDSNADPIAAKVEVQQVVTEDQGPVTATDPTFSTNLTEQIEAGKQAKAELTDRQDLKGSKTEPSMQATDVNAQNSATKAEQPLLNQAATAAQQAIQNRDARAALKVDANVDVAEVADVKGTNKAAPIGATGNQSQVTAAVGELGKGPSFLADKTTIKTPVNQPGFAREVSNTVQWASGRGMTMVDLKVNPESFGPLNLRLVQKGNQISLVIRTQDENAANMLTQALSGLKEVMGNTGLQLGQVQIHHNASNTASQGQGQSNAQQFAEQFGQGHRQGSGQGSQGSAQGQGEQAMVPTERKPKGNGNSHGGLDLFA